jgi:hypothetical protein
LFDGSGGDELFSLLSPKIVLVSASSAAACRVLCCRFRDEIDTAILEWIRRFNTGFAKAQQARRWLDGYTMPSSRRTLLHDSHMSDNEILERYNLAMEEHCKRKHELSEWKCIAKPLGHEVYHPLLKNAALLCCHDLDPHDRRRLVYGNGATKLKEITPYALTESVHTYLSMIAQKCELCACDGVSHTIDPGTMTTLPIHGDEQPMVMHTTTECVRARCTSLNIRSTTPLSNVNSTLNAVVVASLRYVGCLRPTAACLSHRSPAIDLLLSKPKDVRQGATDSLTIRARQHRLVFFPRNPSLPVTYTLQTILHLTDEVVKRGRADAAREGALDDEIARFARVKTKEKLRKDLDALLGMHPDLVDAGVGSLSELDGRLPGAQATFETMLSMRDVRTIEHVLCVPEINEFLHTVRIASVCLVKHDMLLCSIRVASPHAYAFVSGLACGGFGKIEFGSMAHCLRLSESEVGRAEMASVVAAMHAFDAIGTAPLCVVPDVENMFRWTVAIGEGQDTIKISGRATLSSLARSHYRIKTMANTMIRRLGTQRWLPDAPSQHDLDTSNGPSLAAAFITKITNFLIVDVRTRALALYILTNGAISEFVEAVPSASIDAIAAEAMAR